MTVKHVFGLDAFRRLAVIRRLVAIVVLASMSAMPFETLFPDVHDGDAGAAAQGAHVLGVASAASEHEGSREPANQRLPGPTHVMHLDHCAHSHLAAVSREWSLPVGSVPIEARSGTAVTELVSIEFAPLLRPPIA